MNTRGFRPVVANSAMSWMRARSFASPSPEIPTFSGRPWMYSKYCVLVMKEFSRRLLVARREVLEPVRDEHHVTGGHEHRAKQVVLRFTRVMETHVIEDGAFEELHAHHETVLPVRAVAKLRHRQGGRNHRH